MKDTEKNQFDAFATLWKGAWEQFNERRKYEFQISIGVWTALASFTALVITKRQDVESFKLDHWVTWGTIAALIGVFFLYCFWTNGLFRANKKDRRKAFHYEDEMKTICGTDFPDELKAYLTSGESNWALTTWSHGTQIGITFLLTCAAILSVYHYGTLSQ